MANIGNRFILFFILLIFIPVLICSQDSKQQESDAQTASEQKSVELKETKQPDVHQKMLTKLNITSSEEHESFFRRGEVVFFIAFGYTYLYQFLIYDQILYSTYRSSAQKGYLDDRNLYFAIITSLFMALFVARNDLQKQNYLQTGKNYTYPKAEIKIPYERENRSYNWYFNFFSWDF